jgi:hypothetical protein
MALQGRPENGVFLIATKLFSIDLSFSRSLFFSSRFYFYIFHKIWKN